jgi:hypothetical protein
VLFADYLATARAALTPGTEVFPAWVREVTGCSRGLSSRLAAEVRSPTVGPLIPAATPPETGTSTTDGQASTDDTDAEAVEQEPSDQPAGLEGEAA